MNALFLMGADVGAYGGGFGVTIGMLEEFAERIINTPLCESVYTGAGVGAYGGHAAHRRDHDGELQPAGLDQILNNAATVPHYVRRAVQRAPGDPLRMPTGRRQQLQCPAFAFAGRLVRTYSGA